MQVQLEHGVLYLKTKIPKQIQVLSLLIQTLSLQAGFDFASVSIFTHYKKNRLLRRAKSAAKGTFDLQQQAVLSMLQCRYRSIVAVTKAAAINLPFSGTFGLLRRAKNRHHIRLPFGSSGLLAAVNKRRYRASCTKCPMHPLHV